MYCTDGSRFNFYILISNYFCCCLLGDSFLLETKESIVFEKKKIEKNKPYVISGTPSKTCLVTKLSGD